MQATFHGYRKCLTFHDCDLRSRDGKFYKCQEPFSVHVIVNESHGMWYIFHDRGTRLTFHDWTFRSRLCKFQYSTQKNIASPNIWFPECEIHSTVMKFVSDSSAENSDHLHRNMKTVKATFFVQVIGNISRGMWEIFEAYGMCLTFFNWTSWSHDLQTSKLKKCSGDRKSDWCDLRYIRRLWIVSHIPGLRFPITWIEISDEKNCSVHLMGNVIRGMWDTLHGYIYDVSHFPRLNVLTTWT